MEEKESSTDTSPDTSILKPFDSAHEALKSYHEAVSDGSLLRELAITTPDRARVNLNIQDRNLCLEAWKEGKIHYYQVVDEAGDTIIGITRAKPGWHRSQWHRENIAKRLAKLLDVDADEAKKACEVIGTLGEIPDIAEGGGDVVFTSFLEFEETKTIIEPHNTQTGEVIARFEVVDQPPRVFIEAKYEGNVGYVFRVGSEVDFCGEVRHGERVYRPVPEQKDDTGEVIPVVGLPDYEAIHRAMDKCEPKQVFERVREHLMRYIDLTPLDLDLCVFYIIYTWFYRKSAISPYLRLLADTGKGKSRIQDVVGDLCYLPVYASGASSRSGIMRFNQRWRGTLILDESDLRGDERNMMIKYLNLGFEKGKYLIMTDKENHDRQLVFDPFGPKIIAMRQPFEDPATEGRVISITPQETTRQDIPITLPDEYEEEVRELRGMLAAMMLRYWDEVESTPVDKYRDLGVELRLLQLMQPLSVVTQLLPDGEVVFREYLKKRQYEIRKQRALSWRGALTNFVYALCEGEEWDEIPQAVTPGMVARAFNTTAKNASQTLQSVGFTIEQRRIRVKTENGERWKTVRALVVLDERTWGEIARRYLDPDLCEDDNPGCPAQLRGRGYVSPICSLKRDIRDKRDMEDELVTLVADVTDYYTHVHTHTPGELDPITQDDDLDAILKKLKTFIDRNKQLLNNKKRDGFIEAVISQLQLLGLLKRDPGDLTLRSALGMIFTDFVNGGDING